MLAARPVAIHSVITSDLFEQYEQLDGLKSELPGKAK